MERRKFVIGAGALATGSAAAVGTGAFSSTWANRDVTAEVTGDAGAYLGLDIEKGEYATYDGDQFAFDLDELNDDANTRIYNVLKITNNGTNDISVEAQELDNNGNLDGWNQDSLALYWSDEALPEDGSQFGQEDGLMHKDEEFDQTGGPEPVRDIPRIETGESVYVHPHVLLQDNTTDDGVEAIPEEIGFYATVTNL